MQRSAKLERVTFFSDAVFAIAMTLLVIDVRLPAIPNASENSLAQALVDLLPNYIGFAVSFLVIARFWIGHHRLLDMLDTADPKLVRANLTLLLVIAFMPFPTAVLSNYALFRVAEGFYTAMLVLAGLANARLISVAFAHGRSSPSAGLEDDERSLKLSMWSPVVIGGVGFVASIIRPVFGMAVLTIGSPIILYAFAWRARRMASAMRTEAAANRMVADKSYVSTAPGRIDKVLSVGAMLLLGAVLLALYRGFGQWALVPRLIWLHLATILFATVLTPIMLLRTRGTRQHRIIGTVWVVAMLLTAITSLFIHASGPGRFSIIHLLSLYTLVQVPVIWWSARTHNIARHRRGVHGMVIGALLTAGFFTFPFHRLLGTWLFGPH